MYESTVSTGSMTARGGDVGDDNTTGEEARDEWSGFAGEEKEDSEGESSGRLFLPE